MIILFIENVLLIVLLYQVSQDSFNVAFLTQFLYLPTISNVFNSELAF